MDEILNDSKVWVVDDTAVTPRYVHGLAAERAELMALLEDEGRRWQAIGAEIAEISAIAAGGTWRIRAYTDPAGDPVGETSFLVEDYIPDRIAFDLKPLSATASAAEGTRAELDGAKL